MKLRKIFASFVLVFLLAPLVEVGQREVRAIENPETATFVLHKRVFDDTMPEYKENTGLEMPDFGGRALNGAGFTVYDVTAKYHAALVGKTQAEAIAAVIGEYNDDAVGFTKVGNEQFTADPEGTTKFVDLPLYSNDIDAAYLFVETTTPTNLNIVQNAIPVLVSLPIEDPTNEGQSLTTINLYPKNVSREEPKPTPKPEPKPKPKPTPKPKPPGRLPQTGEAKTIIGLFGLLIVGMVSIIWFKRNSNKKTN